MVLLWITSDPKTENVDQSLNFLQKNVFHKKNNFCFILSAGSKVLGQ